MKEIYFSEEQLNSLNEIGQNLFGEENDPTSSLYKRVLVRPKLNYVKMLLCVGIPIALLISYIYVLRVFDIFNLFYLVIALLAVVIYFILFFKKIIICCVKIYQRFAPDKIRKKCRFEPSCSQYMILAIEKHGVIKGMRMGIKRLKRCNVDHGGFDFP